jgi:uncharacterized protein (TIGR02145 family)
MKTLIYPFLVLLILTFVGCKKDEVILNNLSAKEVLSGASGPTNRLKYGSVTDVDGNVYKTIQIGSQVWMAENLKVSRFRNKKAIPNITDNAEWASTTQPAWCNMNNSASDGATYGKLYNWYAVMDSRGLAPKGWHIPSKTEWEQLMTYLGGLDLAGTKIKSDTGWDYQGTEYTNFIGPGLNGTNESGFSALPGGYRNEWVNDGTYWGSYNGFFYPRNCGNWWSTTMIYNDWWPEYSYYFCWIFANDYKVHIDKYPATSGFSVRCIKD